MFPQASMPSHGRAAKAAAAVEIASFDPLLMAVMSASRQHSSPSTLGGQTLIKS
jgi:hypothetical protein